MDSLVDRIERHFAPTARPRDVSLVAGLFGQWGSGKSFMLEMLHAEFMDRAERAGARPEAGLTLPVRFNPWRFETEEHVVIPLLKTTQQRLLRWRRDAGLDGEGTFDWLKDRAVLLSQTAIALSYGVKGKLSIPGGLLQMEFSPEKAIEEEKRRWEEYRRRKEAHPIDDLQSLYYDLHSYMRGLTGRDSEESPHLNLVFLIDDLDRCLPDKAVEMLEAIKLFLEVEGCAFVMALDDEVIERGILHRYRDYSRDGGTQFDPIAFSLDPERFTEFRARHTSDRLSPITGAEYLEKIVHLPFRIPVPPKETVAEFLRESFPDLFSRREGEQGTPQELPRPGAWPAELRATGRPLRPSAVAEPLLQLFLDGVPHVPRKLIRAAELLQLMREVARRRGWTDYDPLTLARLVILQLLAPELYRFGRQNVGFLDAMEGWQAADPEHWRSRRYLDQLIEAKEASLKPGAGPEPSSVDEEPEDAEISEPAVDADERHYIVELTEIPLLRLVRDSLRNRSGFDPRDLIQPDHPSDRNLRPYFSLAGDTGPRGREVAPLAEERLPARLRDQEAFVVQLSSPERKSWLNALGAEELQGRVLDEPALDSLLARLERRDFAVVDVTWIQAVAAYLTTRQLQRLVSESALLRRLERAAPTDPGAAQELRESIEVLCRAVNPPHRPVIAPVDLAQFGADGLDLGPVSLNGAYLRGLRHRGRLPTSQDGLDAADLEGADLRDSRPADLRHLDLRRTRLLNARLGTEPQAPSALRALPAAGPPPFWPTASSQMTCLALLPDRRLASGGSDGVVRLWDPEAGKSLAELPGQEGWVVSLAALPDGRLASGSDDGFVRLWDPDAGQILAELRAHKGWVWSLAVLPGGRLANTGEDGVVRLWDPATGKTLGELRGHDSWVTSLAVLPDGRLASGAGDGVVCLWDPDAGRLLAELRGHEKAVRSLAVLPDGRLASSGDDLIVRLWDPDAGKTLTELRGHVLPVQSLAALPDGRLASGGDDGVVRLWDPEAGKTLAKLRGHEHGVLSLAALPAGRLASGGRDGVVRLWDPHAVRTGAELRGHDGWVSDLAALPDGRLASSGGSEDLVRLWDPDAGRILAELRGHEGRVRSLAILPEGRLASGGDDGVVRLWDLDAGKTLAELRGHKGRVRSLAALPDGRIASGGHDGIVRLWDPDAGKTLAELSGHELWVTSLAVLADGRLASGGSDGVVRLWDPDAGKTLAELSSHERFVTSLAVLADGRLASGGHDGIVRLWDPDAGKTVAELSSHESRVLSLAALPDGRLAGACDDGVVRLWHPDAGGTLTELGSNETWVGSLAVLPNGRLASGGSCGLAVWDLEAGRALLRTVPVEPGVWLAADARGVHLGSREKPWQVLERAGAHLPDDPVLHRYAGFILDRRFWIEVRHCPKAFRWDDPPEPHCLTLRWPDGFDPAEILGTVVQPTDALSVPFKDRFKI